MVDGVIDYLLAVAGVAAEYGADRAVVSPSRLPAIEAAIAEALEGDAGAAVPPPGLFAAGDVAPDRVEFWLGADLVGRSVYTP